MVFLLIASLNERGEKYTFPLGMAYVSSVLKRDGYDVVCKNMEFEQDPIKTLETLLAEVKPDVVAIGGLSHSYTQILSYFRLVSEKFASAVRILGGGIASGDPLFVVEQLPIDIAVIGEAEETILDVAHAITNGGDLSKVPGIAIRDEKGKPMKTPYRPVITDLDTIPWPDYEGFNYQKHIEIRGSYIEMIASRGCPYRCTFCSSNLGRKYRVRSLESFFEELLFYKEKYKIETVAIYDELFTLNKERLYKFCELMEKLDLTWWTQLRIDSFDEKILKAMVRSGCSFISLGLESMNDQILKSMRKKITTKQLQDSLKLIMINRIGLFGNFIFGDPEETEETAWSTLKWWREHLEYGINTGFIHTYPGAQIYEYAIEHEIIRDKLTFYENDVPLINISKMRGFFNALINAVNSYLFFTFTSAPALINNLTIST